jgi:hypothetical protein
MAKKLLTRSYSEPAIVPTKRSDMSHNIAVELSVSSEPHCQNAFILVPAVLQEGPDGLQAIAHTRPR